MSNQDVHVLLVNAWSKRPEKLDRIITQLGYTVTPLNPHARDMLLTMEAPEVVIVGFGAGSKDAAAFISDFKSSRWFRRVPLLAVIESRDSGLLELCMRWGCDDGLVKPFSREQLHTRITTWNMRSRMRNEERAENERMQRDKKRTEKFGNIIVPLGVAMMSETNFDRLLEMILVEAKKFCNADGGTLYLVEEDHTLSFNTVINDSLNIHLGGSSDSKMPFEPLPLYNPEDGKNQPVHIATHVVKTGDTINVADAYLESDFDFSGTKTFDKESGYRTRSVLTIPLRNTRGTVIGVLQLLNPLNEDTRKPTTFDSISETLMQSLSVLAASAMDSYRRLHQMQAHAEALAIDIDEEEKQKHVSEIVKSDYFQELKKRAGEMRAAAKKKEPTSAS